MRPRVILFTVSQRRSSGRNGSLVARAHCHSISLSVLCVLIVAIVQPRHLLSRIAPTAEAVPRKARHEVVNLLLLALRRGRPRQPLLLPR